ncbi:MAG: hypothetical protein L6Q95_01860 [Planctomycetes bacterium]|nr:hypothetical protein [Planctomycetota bacterium]
MIRRLLRPFWVRWIVLPLLLLLAAHAGWTLTLKWEFEGRIAKLRAAGEPVDLGDLRRPRIPDEDNAAALWEEAHKWYEEHMEPAPDKLDWGEDTWFEEDHAEIASWLERGDPYVDLLARAAAKPDMWQDLDWEAGLAMEVKALPQMQTAATFLRNRVRMAERATPEVLRELATILDLAPKLERSCLILVLVRWTVEEIAAESLVALAGRPGFDARAARALLDPRFARIDVASDLRKAFRGERVIGLSVSRRWIAGESVITIARETGNLLSDDARQPDPTRVDFSGSWIVRPLAYRDALRLLDLMDGALGLVELPARDARPRAEALRDEYARGVPNFLSHLWAILPMKAIPVRLRHEARIRIARVGLALLELRQTTGAWPESLDAVVPLVGEEWAIDPYTGERLQYEPGVRLEAAVPVPEAFKDMPEEYEIVWRFGG